MTAASLDLPVRRSVALSMSMSAFAGGGMIWPPIFTAIIDWRGPHAVLLLFAAYLILIGAVGGLLMHAARPPAHPGAHAGGGLFSDILTRRPRVFILLWLGFIFIGFAALMSIGHAAGIVMDFGFPAGQA